MEGKTKGNVKSYTANKQISTFFIFFVMVESEKPAAAARSFCNTLKSVRAALACTKNINDCPQGSL